MHLLLDPVQVGPGAFGIGFSRRRPHGNAVQCARLLDEVVHDSAQREVAASVVVGSAESADELVRRHAAGLAEQLLGAAPEDLLLVPDLGPTGLGKPEAAAPPRLILQAQPHHHTPLQPLDVDVADEPLPHRLEVGGLWRAHLGSLPQRSPSRKSATTRLVASGCSSGAKWPAAGIAANCAPGIACAIRRMPSGGAILSSSPAITSAGTAIEPSIGVESGRSRSACSAPTSPGTGVRVIISRTCATTSGWAANVAGASTCGSSRSATAAAPARSASAAISSRPRRASLESATAFVLQNTAARTRPGWRRSNSNNTYPPSESPHITVRSSSSVSSTCTTSSA